MQSGLTSWGRWRWLALAVIPLSVWAQEGTATVAAAPAMVGGFVVDAVLVALVLMSVAVWAIAGYKLWWLRALEARNAEFRDIFWRNPDLKLIAQTSEQMRGVSYAELFLSAHRAWRMSKKLAPTMATSERIAQIERVLSSELEAVTARLDSYTGVLATTATSAPFIGLFGTVWGILRSFKAIGLMQSASLSVVAPGLSEALVATAVGLIAAIPAAILYNVVARRIEGIRVDCVVFSAELTNIMASLDPGAHQD